MQIKKIEFQSDKRDVLITCELTQENSFFSSNYIISHSELNKIIGDLQAKNSFLDIYELMERNEISDDLVLYTLNLEQSGIQNTLIPQFSFPEQSRQIRA